MAGGDLVLLATALLLLGGDRGKSQQRNETYYTSKGFGKAAAGPGAAHRAAAMVCLAVDAAKRSLAEAAIYGKATRAARQHRQSRHLV